MGKISEHIAKRHGLPGKFSHRNLKIHFLWENSAASLWKRPAWAELFPIENSKNIFLWEKILGDLPKDMVCPEDFPTET